MASDRFSTASSGYCCIGMTCELERQRLRQQTWPQQSKRVCTELAALELLELSKWSELNYSSSIDRLVDLFDRSVASVDELKPGYRRSQEVHPPHERSLMLLWRQADDGSESVQRDTTTPLSDQSHDIERPMTKTATAFRGQGTPKEVVC